jgi:hypothetical protein
MRNRGWVEGGRKSSVPAVIGPPRTHEHHDRLGRLKAHQLALLVQIGQASPQNIGLRTDNLCAGFWRQGQTNLWLEFCRQASETNAYWLNIDQNHTKKVECCPSLARRHFDEYLP